MAKKKSCKFVGFEHPHDSEMCQADRCVRCNDGMWEDTGKKCPC